MASLAKHAARGVRSIRVRLERHRKGAFAKWALVLAALMILGVLFLGIAPWVNHNGMAIKSQWHLQDRNQSSAQVPSSSTLVQGSADDRAEAVRQMMTHAWDSYVKYAWGADELAPLAKRGRSTFGGCTAVTVLDAIDTLYIMGLNDRYEKAKSWIQNSLDFGCVTTPMSHFETTIRSLGGLMSMYHLTEDKVYLNQVEKLGSKLLTCFDSVLPKRTIDLGQSSCTQNGNLAEIGTLQLEWRALSAATENPTLKEGRKKAESAVLAILRSLRNDEIPAKSPYEHDGRVNLHGEMTMAGDADSFFEYLIKSYIQGGSSKQEEHYRVAFDRIMRLVIERMVVNTGGMYRVIHLNPHSDRMDHLTCFLPGSLMLSVHAAGTSLSEQDKKDFLRVAEGLTETCYKMYSLSPSGLAPEVIEFQNDQMTGPDRHTRYNLLRPEAVEAIFYMWRFTHNPKYREWNWKIFEAIEREAKTEAGYTCMEDVWTKKPRRKDEMSSFFLAETIKYLYLTFTNDSVIPLDQWVFNTEAHPLRVDAKLGNSAIPLMPSSSSNPASGQQLKL
mmetsp:Transcript_8747/g.17727  ORF Transcript_8747/g.17727 Transcript_8747/m.17727 type:complete len:557 (-) Transcript_8747:624-2294(-)|eukprot:CAMPEP_0184687456 /NCGR_PEP_ID=MMETSP0312-20130426/26452_1 /TAXON_ID=31354 /ORGANISM="Compsopogon coeruleus, Strain SAG 36.94" /LENGTH=556 /DNA_ID=CAMNT_0027143619 /DNA_START=372 /DNA_END=2042 /DNA_ORIENTATION=-